MPPRSRPPRRRRDTGSRRGEAKHPRVIFPDVQRGDDRRAPSRSEFCPTVPRQPGCTSKGSQRGDDPGCLNLMNWALKWTLKLHSHQRSNLHMHKHHNHQPSKIVNILSLMWRTRNMRRNREGRRLHQGQSIGSTSSSGRILDDFRSSLTPFMLEALVCAQDWLKRETPVEIQESQEQLKVVEKELVKEFGALHIDKGKGKGKGDRSETTTLKSVVSMSISKP